MVSNRFPLLYQTVRDSLRGMVYWSIGIVAVISLYLLVYPSMIEGQEAYETVFDNLPEALVEGMGWHDITSGPGYLDYTVYSLFGPIFLLILAISYGSRLVAGEESQGALDVYLSYPLDRTRLLLERFGALVSIIIGIGALLGLVVAGYVVLLDMGVSMNNIVAGTVGLILLAIFFGTLALCTGAATGRTGVVMGVAAGFAVLSYVFQTLAPIVDWLGWIETLSPFHYAIGGDPLRAGFDVTGIIVLIGATGLVLGAGIMLFERRDVRS